MSSDRHTIQEASEPKRSKAPIWVQEVEDVFRKFRRTKACSKALKRIEPASDRRAQCEIAIGRAVLWIRICKALDKSPSAAARKQRFRKYAEKLRAVEIAGYNLDPYVLMCEP